MDISTYMFHRYPKLNISKTGLIICSLPHILSFSFILTSWKRSLLPQLPKITVSESLTLLTPCLPTRNQVLIDATSKRVPALSGSPSTLYCPCSGPHCHPSSGPWASALLLSLVPPPLPSSSSRHSHRALQQGYLCNTWVHSSHSAA